MFNVKPFLCACLLTACCALVVAGCSEDQKKQDGKKSETTQERLGREAAEGLKKPLDEAKKAAAEVSAKADQALQAGKEGVKQAAKEAGLAPNAPGGKEKKKMEGC